MKYINDRLIAGTMVVLLAIAFFWSQPVRPTPINPTITAIQSPTPLTLFLRLTVAEDISSSALRLTLHVQVNFRRLSGTNPCVDLSHVTLKVQPWPATQLASTLLPIATQVCAHDAAMQPVGVGGGDATSYEVVEQQLPEIRMELPVDPSFFYAYPFDRLTINTNLLVVARNQGPTVPWDVHWELRYVGRETMITHTPSTSTMVAVRPLPYRALALILVPTSLLLLLLLVTLHDIGTLYQCSLGLLFGLWGIRQVLVPPALSSPGAIDYLFVYLYILLMLLTLYKTGRILLAERYLRRLRNSALLQRLLDEHKGQE